jgi:ATP-dependent helicase/nuclease subunit A
MRQPTAQQQAAIAARGNVLVVAGAGAGKTRTSVDRCLAWLLDARNPGSIDQILMVTFTEAAAAEMRQRLRAQLEAVQAADPSPHAAEQLALLETAWICTLHSFCFRLVREHFYTLGLDPQLIVLPEERAQLLARQALDSVLQQNYSLQTAQAGAIQETIQSLGGDSDLPVRTLVLRLHHYAQTLPDPEAWFDAQAARFQQSAPGPWPGWLMAEMESRRRAWLPVLRAQPADNPCAQQCAAALDRLPQEPSRPEFAAALEAIFQAAAGSKPKWRKPVENILAEARFLRSVCAVEKTDPLAEDWNWCAPTMLALLDLTRQFGQAYRAAKREAGGLDFHDLEQFALQLLRDRETGRPGPIAEQWRARLRLIFVDEFQDINRAQEAILCALGREGAEANRFLVGDIKQSIYRFRLADPRIFLDYRRAWETQPGARVISLSDNFRSHQDILNFVNSVFAALMRPELGGIDYDDQARLRFGNPEERAPHATAEELTRRMHISAGSCHTLNGRAALPRRPELGRSSSFALPDHEITKLTGGGQGTARPTLESLAGGAVTGATGESAPRVELLLRRIGRDPDEEGGGETSDAETISDTEKEARLVGRRLLELKDQELAIPGQPPRRAAWSDMVILLRSPRHKAEAYVKEFARLGVPLAAVRGGFYESQEVRDLLSLLQVLDNPAQDLPLLGVLRSPLVGLTAGELAAIRLAQRPGRFWAALLRWQQAHPEHERVHTFLQRFRAWRRLSRLAGVSPLLEKVVEETGFGQLLAGAPEAAQCAANVSRLIHLTRQFDGFRGEGLYRFLQYVQAQQENELDAEPAGQPLRDAVRLMSIHQSKGLEFPIVALADLGKRFNLEDARGRVILDEELGLCPQVKPPGFSQFYPSLPHWLAQRRQKRETYGEELRLLYVALTRAEDRLILCGSARRKTMAEKWPLAAERGLGAAEILAGRSFLDWLGAWLVLQIGPEAPAQSGGNSLLTWKIVDEQEPAAAPGPAEAAPAPPARDAEERLLRQGQAALQWRYGFEDATRRAAKTSVSALRRLVADEEDDESELLFTPLPDTRGERRAGALSAAEIGSAHHAFLERVALEETAGTARLQGEAARLLREGSLSQAQAACLDFKALAAFWQSEVGRQLLSRRENVRREVAFTARFSPVELEELQGREDESEKPSPQSLVVGRAVPCPPGESGAMSDSGLLPDGGQGTARPTLHHLSGTNRSPEDSPAGCAEEAGEEFVIVQGVMDLAVVTPEEIWVLDFKTDHFAEQELEVKVRLYRPQLTLYARAIARIYGRPVTRRWLHFFAVGRTVELAGD